MYSVKLPDIVAQQQENKRLNNNNWRKAQQHKQKMGKLDDNGMRIASFYRSRAGNVTVALSETLTAQVSALPAKHNQEFHAAVNSITGILSSMRDLPADASAAHDAAAGASMQTAKDAAVAATAQDTAAATTAQPSQKRARQAARPVPNVALLQAHGPGSFTVAQLAGFMSAQAQQMPRTTKPALMAAVQDHMFASQGISAPLPVTLLQEVQDFEWTVHVENRAPLLVLMKMSVAKLKLAVVAAVGHSELGSIPLQLWASQSVMFPELDSAGLPKSLPANFAAYNAALVYAQQQQGGFALPRVCNATRAMKRLYDDEPEAEAHGTADEDSSGQPQPIDLTNNEAGPSSSHAATQPPSQPQAHNNVSTCAVKEASESMGFRLEPSPCWGIAEEPKVQQGFSRRTCSQLFASSEQVWKTITCRATTGFLPGPFGGIKSMPWRYTLGPSSPYTCSGM
ncbi:hypothetical protein ABBQ32_008599 [Trebouxia sp. C0010 RCD-2024]